MKRLTVILVLFSNFSLFGQTTKKDTADIYINSFDVYYGYRSYFQNFYNQLNTTNNTQFNKPLQTIGIGYSGELESTREHKFFSHFLYSQIIPQTIHIKDTIKCKITGFVFSAAYGRALTTKSGVFNTFFYIGFNTGRLRMYDNELVRQKNPFFSPKLGLQPKVRLGHIIISFIVEYEYDISKSNWRRTLFSNNDKVSLNNLKQTGLTGLVAIGFTL